MHSGSRLAQLKVAGPYCLNMEMADFRSTPCWPGPESRFDLTTEPAGGNFDGFQDQEKVVKVIHEICLDYHHDVVFIQQTG